MKVSEKALALLASMLVAGCVAFAGCSSGSSSSAESSSSSSDSLSAQAEEEVLVLGEETGTALAVELTNMTGTEITDFAVMPAGSADEPKMLMPKGKTFADKGKAHLYAEPIEGELYDALVVCGEKSYTLHDLNLAKMEQATIRLDEDVAFVETVIDGNAVSSLRDEYDRAHPQEAEAAEQASEPVAEESGAVADEGHEDYADATATYVEEPAAEAAPEAAPEQSEDACVSDVVLR